MIDKASLSAEWLAEKRKQYKKDPGIMEGMIYAFITVTTCTAV